MVVGPVREAEQTTARGPTREHKPASLHGATQFHPAVVTPSHPPLVTIRPGNLKHLFFPVDLHRPVTVNAKSSIFPPKTNYQIYLTFLESVHNICSYHV